MKPLISIILPTYNRPFLLKQALESVLIQKYLKWECLIIDDGSSWKNLQEVRKFVAKDPRIRFYERPEKLKKGASSCRNYGLSIAKGELIQFLDDDDLLDSEKLSEQVKHYCSDNKLVLFTCRWGGFTNSEDLKSRFKYRYNSYRNFKKGVDLLNTFGLYNEYFPLHVYLTPVTLIQKAGVWNEELSNNDDAEFFTRIILSAGTIQHIPEAKVYYRYGNSQKLSVLDSTDKIRSFIKSLKLIETYIYQQNWLNSMYYTKRSKANLYIYLEKNDPKTLNLFLKFLRDRNTYNNLFYKILKRIKS